MTKKRRYEAIRSYFTTVNARDGSVTDILRHYERVHPTRDSRLEAITDGWDAWHHDDFNIAVWRGDKLISWDWMDDILVAIADGEDELARIQRELLPPPRGWSTLR
jgi:hypothetical protein